MTDLSLSHMTNIAGRAAPVCVSLTAISPRIGTNFAAKSLLASLAILLWGFFSPVRRLFANELYTYVTKIDSFPQLMLCFLEIICFSALIAIMHVFPKSRFQLFLRLKIHKNLIEEDTDSK